MLKKIFSSIAVGLLSITCLFGAGNGPLRHDLLSSDSPGSHIKMERAAHILATLVPDWQNYQIILSSNPSFGGEAVPPYVYSDKPVMIIYQGSLGPNRSNEEIAFMMAHELGHLKLHHNEKMMERMDKIYNGPIMGISGLVVSNFYQKLEERQADLFGLYLYEKAGYDRSFFQHTLNLIRINPNLHLGTNDSRPLPTSLSMSNSHFSLNERFELLTKEAHIPNNPLLFQFSHLA